MYSLLLFIKKGFHLKVLIAFIFCATSCTKTIKVYSIIEFGVASTKKYLSAVKLSNGIHADLNVNTTLQNDNVK